MSEVSLITFRRDTEWQQEPQHAAVHLKGFASRISQAETNTAALGDKLVEWFVDKHPAQLVWDGDNHAHDSFTWLIPRIHEALSGATSWDNGRMRQSSSLELIAFVRECDTERFESSWGATGLPVSVYLCNDSLDWQMLGTHALGVTGANSVVCWGGGDTVRNEFEARSSSAVTFTVFPICRPSSTAGTPPESCSLLAHEPAEGLTVISLEAAAAGTSQSSAMVITPRTPTTPPDTDGQKKKRKKKKVALAPLSGSPAEQPPLDSRSPKVVLAPLSGSPAEQPPLDRLSPKVVLAPLSGSPAQQPPLDRLSPHETGEVNSPSTAATPDKPAVPQAKEEAQEEACAAEAPTMQKMDPAEHSEHSESEDSEEIGFYYLCEHGLIDEVYAEVAGDVSELTDDRDYEGCTGLHIACREGQVEVVKLLLGFAVDGKKGQNKGKKLQLPETHIITRELLEGSKLLDDYGNSPLLSACRKCHEPCSSGVEGALHPSYVIIKLLLEHGAAVYDEKESSGITPLHWAAYHGQLNLVQLLLEHGGDPLRTTGTVGDKFSIDMAGIMHNNRKQKVSRLKTIAEVGLEVTKKHKTFLAADHLGCVKMIIQFGMEVRAVHALQCAELGGRRSNKRIQFTTPDTQLFDEATKLLSSAQQYAFDPLTDYPGDNQTWSPIHECAKQGWKDLLAVLLERAQARHPEPLTQLYNWDSNEESYTPLHVACISRRLSTARLLKEWCEKQGQECVNQELLRQTANGHIARDFWDDVEKKDEFSTVHDEKDWEYVLVFSNAAKIMKVINDMLTSTSTGQPLITKQVAATNINLETGSKIIFLLVSASDAVIFAHAQKIGLMMRKRNTTRYSPFEAASAGEFEPMMYQLHNLAEAGVTSLCAMQMEGTIDDLFPLHTPAIQKELSKSWWHDDRTESRMFPPAAFIKDLYHERNSTRFVELNACFRYMGAGHALYFSWFCTFTTTLLPLMPFAIILLAHQTYTGDVDSFLAPYYMVIVSIWAVVSNEKWKRKQSELVSRWSLTAQSVDMAPTRPEFKGNFVITEPNLKVEKRFPSSIRSTRSLTAASILVAMLALVISGFMTVEILKQLDEFQDATLVNDCIKTGLALVNGSFIAIMNILYLNLAQKMTTWENLRTQKEHDDYYIAKTFVFQSINSFTPIFITAYGDLNHDGWELLTLMVTATTVLQSMDAFIAFVMPWIKLKAKLKLNGIDEAHDDVFQIFYRGDVLGSSCCLADTPIEDPSSPRVAPEGEVLTVEQQLVSTLELQYCQEPPPDLTQLYSSKVVLFGFVILFASLGAVTAIHLCLFAFLIVRIEMIGFVYCYRRGPIIDTADIGAWMKIIEGMAFMCVTNSCVYIFLCTDQLDRYADEDVYQLAIIVIVEHAVLYLNTLVAAMIADTPEYVSMKKLGEHDRDATEKAENTKIRKLNKQVKKIKSSKKFQEQTNS